MTDTVTIPTHALTLAEWEALGDGEDVRNLELVEGMLVVTPRPIPNHQIAVARLAGLLDRQLPDDLVPVPDVEVLIELEPPTVRAPDIVVAPTSTAHGVKRFDASDVVLAVEFVSPGSRRADTVAKVAEYQDAGIPSYWIVDLDAVGDARFVAYELRDGRYEAVLRSPDEVQLQRPCPIAFTISGLLTRRS